MTRDSLTAEAPAWLQASFLGLLGAAIVYGVCMLGVLALPLWDTASPWWPVALVAIAYFIWYQPRATARVSVLVEYTEMLAAKLDEQPAVTRSRIWSTRGPAWRTVGLSPLFATAALALPGILFFMADMLADIGDGAKGRALAWTLVSVAALMTVAIVWLTVHTMRRRGVARILIRAAHNPDQRTALVAEAVETTQPSFPRSVSFWIGTTFLWTWFVLNQVGRATHTLDVSATIRVLLVMTLTALVVAPMIMAAKAQGAPSSIWLGVALSILVNFSLTGIMYAAIWKSVGSSITEVTDYPLPPEFIKSMAQALLAETPVVLIAWRIATSWSPLKKAAA